MDYVQKGPIRPDRYHEKLFLEATPIFDGRLRKNGPIWLNDFPRHTFEEEQLWFEKLDICRYRLNKGKDLRLWLRRHAHITHYLFTIHQRTAKVFAPRLLGVQPTVEDAYSEICTWVLKALNLFDRSVGVRFNSYLFRAALSNISRLWRDERARRGKLTRTGYFEDAIPVFHDVSVEAEVKEITETYQQNKAQLSLKERALVDSRFGFGADRRSTLELGREHGVSRQRISIIQCRALRKLKSVFASR